MSANGLGVFKSGACLDSRGGCGNLPRLSRSYQWYAMPRAGCVQQRTHSWSQAAMPALPARSAFAKRKVTSGSSLVDMDKQVFTSFNILRMQLYIYTVYIYVYTYMQRVCKDDELSTAWADFDVSPPKVMCYSGGSCSGLYLRLSLSYHRHSHNSRIMVYYIHWYGYVWKWGIPPIIAI